MTPTIDRFPSDLSERILCCYVNGTSKIQIARITNIANWYFEQTIFPGQRFLFESVLEAELEVYESSETGKVICSRIPCNYLQVQEAGEE